jgi:uncharacterized protein (TIGR03083 family)
MQAHAAPGERTGDENGPAMTDTWAMIADARTDLAEYLETLGDGEWDAPSLCRQWRVRDVVAHVVQATTKIRVDVIIKRLVHNGFNVNQTIANAAKEGGVQPPAQLLKELRAGIHSQIRPPTTSARSLLGDLVVHTQDIRRALGPPGTIPEARLTVTLDHMRRVGVLGNKKRVAGLTLRATDIDWSCGSGPEVSGSGEALLMAMCGRKVALADLTGPGVALLAAR